jgi:hypothetical protein
MSDSWDILPIAAGSVVFGDGFTASGLRWKTLGDDLLFHHFVTFPRGTFIQRVYLRSVNPAIWPVTSVALGSTFSSVSNQLASTRFSTLAESGPVRTKPKIKESLRSPGTEGRCSYDMTEVQSY